MSGAEGLWTGQLCPTVASSRLHGASQVGFVLFVFRQPLNKMYVGGSSSAGHDASPGNAATLTRFMFSV